MISIKYLVFILYFSFVVCEEEDEFTVKYTSENFNTELAKKHNFVMFYAPWCGFCKRLAPTWEQLAEMLNKDEDLCIAKVDCTVEKDLCSEHDITGYPTMKFFKKGVNDGVKFRGTRDLTSLVNFVAEQRVQTPVQQDNVTSEEPNQMQGLVELNEDNFEKFISSGKHFVKFYAPWCGHCQKLAPTWEQLASSLENDLSISICKIDCTQNRQICTQFDIKGYPTLLWIEDGKRIDKYQGQRTYEDLHSYVKKMMGNVDVNIAPEEPAEEPTAVVLLNGDDFEEGIKHGTSFVKFFAPWCGHCKRLAPIWEDLGKKFISNPSITIAKVDCTSEQSKTLCSNQEVDGFPTLYLYKNGEKVAEYKGSRSLESFQQFVLNPHDEL